MVFSALLWAALDSSANALQGVGVARELVTIMQGVIVLSVVVAYEFVRRYRLVLEASAMWPELLAAQEAADEEVAAMMSRRFRESIRVAAPRPTGPSANSRRPPGSG